MYVRYKKMLEKTIVHLKKIYKLAPDYFFTSLIFFHLFIENVFIKIKNSIFPPKYTRYGKNVRIQNCLFQKDLQL